MTTRKKRRGKNVPDLRERVLAHFDSLRLPMTAEKLDLALALATRRKLSHLAFLEALLEEEATRRRERSIERRIREARFSERKTLEEFDWEFNKKSIDRLQIEELATGDFIRRQDNLVMVGQSGLGKSHLIQAIGLKACVVGYRVRYTTSASLLMDLTASLADKTLPQKLRRYTSRPELLIIDEFGFDRMERSECPQAASLLYKVIDLRYRQRSTALITNVDFEGWPEYLGDAPLAMGFMDRLVDGAIILKMKGNSYRAHRAKNVGARSTKSGSTSAP
jgi:DNA replication protein DnaC